MAKILIADVLPDEAVTILSGAGLEVVVKVGRSEAEILEDIGEYDGLIVRSATVVTREILRAATRLKVVGRAGVGTDNIDKEAASERGVVVMNTPLGNIVSAAEHTLAMMLAMARDLPAAHGELREGVWNRKGHTGVELEGKTLAIVGLGRIGQHVARVARALGMKLVGFDPYINPERAGQIGVELAELPELLRRADFLTVHVPKTAETEALIGAAQLTMMKRSARVINVARGGIVDEAALAEALNMGIIAGAAIDVFEEEPPAADLALLKAKNVVLTPHLGASTAEAQSKVAEQVAAQFVAFFVDGEIQNAINLSVHLEPELAPYGELATTLGSLAIQLADNRPVSQVRLVCHGEIAKGNTRALAVCALSGVLKQMCSTPVNLVNASSIAESRGIRLVEERSQEVSAYTNKLSVEVVTVEGMKQVAGARLDGNQVRIVEIDGWDVDLRPAGWILVMRYPDRPGMVGRFGTILGDAGINIANMDVGRLEKGSEAIVSLTVDDPVPEGVIAALRQAIEPSEIHLVRMD